MKKCTNPECMADNPKEAKFCHMCGVNISKRNKEKSESEGQTGARIQIRNFLKWFFCIAVIVSIGVLGYSVFSSCRQAWSDGQEVAKKHNECQNRFVTDLQMDVNRFVASFDVNKYENRDEVRNELEDIHNNRKEIYEREHLAVLNYKDSIRTEYENRPLSRKIFDNSFLGASKNRNFEDEVDAIINDKKVQVCLYGLLPVKPDNRKICKDLEGHKLKGVVGNPFFDDSWSLVIQKRGVEKVHAVTWVDNGEKKKAKVQMIVKEGGHSLSVGADLIYALDESRESWELQDVITHNVSINKTTTYNDAIDISWGFDRYGNVNVEMMNRNESPLLVGVYVWTNEGWGGKKISLSSDKKKTIRCGILYDMEAPILEDFFRIDFIEKL